MGYESKVILKAVVKLIEKADSKDEALKLVKDIANAEEVVPESD